MIEILPLVGSPLSRYRDFGSVVVAHKETRYVLAIIRQNGKLEKTDSPLAIRPDECVEDPDFGELARIIISIRVESDEELR